MNRAEQVKPEAWVDTQKTLWENWLDRMSSLPTASMYSEFAGQRQNLAPQAVEGPQAVEPHARDIAERLVNTQAAMTRLMELCLNAWSAMLPMVESGQDWQSALHTYTEQMRQELTQSITGTANATQEVSALWQQYLQQWRVLAQPWVQALQQTPAHFAQAAGGERLQLLELSNVYWGAWDQTFGRLINPPSLGVNRELQEKFVAAFNAWLSVRQANREYQIRLADTWVKAFEQFMRKVISRTERGDPVSSLRELTNLWVDVAEHVYGDAFRSDECVRIQGQLLNSTMAYHIRQRAIVEDISSSLSVPTRSEVDAAHRNIYELRKEIKALRRALQSLEAQVAERQDLNTQFDGGAAAQTAQQAPESGAAVAAKEEQPAEQADERIPAETSTPTSSVDEATDETVQQKSGDEVVTSTGKRSRRRKRMTRD